METLSFSSMLIGVDKLSRRRQRHLDVSSLPWSDSAIAVSQEHVESNSHPMLEAVLDTLDTLKKRQVSDPKYSVGQNT